MKKCYKCLEVKPKIDFCKQKASKDGLQSQCRKCNNITSKTWIKANPEVAQKKCKRYAAEYPNKIKGNKLTTYWPNCFALEALNNYNKLLVKQNYVCAICKQSETVFDKKNNITRMLSVDHCHKTNKVRGLLCSNCNTAIGLLKDSSHLCITASDYLNDIKL